MNNLFSMLTLICLGFLNSMSVFADTASKAEFYANVEVQYFAHNGPSIEEFKVTKERIGEVVNKILAYGYEPSTSTIVIGIAPRPMNGYETVEDNNKIYVSFTASNVQIERALLKYFLVQIHDNGRIYFLHNGALVEELNVGFHLVERALARFADNGLELHLPNDLAIGISPSSMNGENIVEVNGKVYISITSTEMELERYFIKYVW